MTFAEFLEACELNGRRLWCLLQDDQLGWMLVVIQNREGMGRMHRVITGKDVDLVLKAGASIALRIPDTGGDSPVNIVKALPPRRLFEDVV